MSPRCTKQTVTTHRVPNDRVSPDDIAARINEARARELSDTRTAAQRFMGDPHPAHSALAQRQNAPRPGPMPSAPSATAQPRFASWGGSMGRLNRMR
jgi:hypothetical protein